MWCTPSDPRRFPTLAAMTALLLGQKLQPAGRDREKMAALMDEHWSDIYKLGRWLVVVVVSVGGVHVWLVLPFWMFAILNVVFLLLMDLLIVWLFRCLVVWFCGCLVVRVCLPFFFVSFFNSMCASVCSLSMLPQPIKWVKDTFEHWHPVRFRKRSWNVWNATPRSLTKNGKRNWTLGQRNWTIDQAVQELPWNWGFLPFCANQSWFGKHEFEVSKYFQ